MHRYDELEKKYYRKLFAKIFLLFVLIVILVFLGYFFIFHKSKSSKNVIKVQNTLIESKKSKKPVKKHKKITKNEENKTKIKTTTISKPKKIKQKPKKVENNLELKFIVPEINVSNENTKTNIKKIRKNKTFLKETNATEKNLSTKIPVIKISETSVGNVSILINKYNKNPNYDLAIMISKIYFNKNKLNKAELWALKANELNPQRTESWIIFADILIKKKKYEKAKEILKTYINSYGQNDIIEEKLRSINE